MMYDDHYDTPIKTISNLTYQNNKVSSHYFINNTIYNVVNYTVTDISHYETTVHSVWLGIFQHIWIAKR